MAARLKADLAMTLERVSKAIIAQGKKGSASGKNLTDLHLLGAYFGTQLWLHDRSGSRHAENQKRPRYDIAALSFVEPCIDACPQAKAAAQLGRQVGAGMGVSGLGDEEVEPGTGQ